MLVSLMMLACGEKSNAGTANGQTMQAKESVEVIYFHGKQRCTMCVAIEQNTLKAVNTELETEKRNGLVTVRVVDLSKTEGREFAKQFGVKWLTLLVVHKKNGKETAENLTDYAFDQIQRSPDGYRKGLAGKVRQMLGQK